MNIKLVIVIINHTSLMKGGEIMSKLQKKQLLFGSTSKKLPLMAHWNNDSGCRA